MEVHETSIGCSNMDDALQVFTDERKYLTKIKKLKAQYPDEVEIVAENKDGSMLIHVPKSWLVFPRPPVRKSLTEEQKQEMSERMRRNRKRKGGDS